MSVAVYIACEREPEGVDTYVDGKAIGHVDPDLLDEIAERAGATPFYEFMSYDPAELADEMVGVDPSEAAPEQWFPARDGLQSIQRHRGYLADNPDEVDDADAIIRDLEDFERLLILLDKKGIGFHFAVDY